MISVIIPTLNEENNLKRCVESIKNEGVPCEIIVADGGSTDDTVAVALGCGGVKVVEARKGRGSQLNEGTFAASGDELLFLHADTFLEKGWADAVVSALADPSCVGGAFTFAIAHPGKRYRLTEYWVKLRCSVLKLPYGDQGLFIRKDVIEKIGGYKDIPLMEDVDMVERLKKAGGITILGVKAFTQDRRWAKKGWVRVSLMNQVIMILYRIGVEPRTLARLYYRR
jgi:rSAM/selenodomain-associated transferase 2